MLRGTEFVLDRPRDLVALLAHCARSGAGIRQIEGDFGLRRHIELDEQVDQDRRVGVEDLALDRTDAMPFQGRVQIAGADRHPLVEDLVDHLLLILSAELPDTLDLIRHDAVFEGQVRDGDRARRALLAFDLLGRSAAGLALDESQNAVLLLDHDAGRRHAALFEDTGLADPPRNEGLLVDGIGQRDRAEGVAAEGVNGCHVRVLL